MGTADFEEANEREKRGFWEKKRREIANILNSIQNFYLCFIQSFPIKHITKSEFFGKIMKLSIKIDLKKKTFVFKTAFIKNLVVKHKTKTKTNQKMLKFIKNTKKNCNNLLNEIKIKRIVELLYLNN